MKDRYLVWVKCFTFNQSAFIVDTLNGFCIQETNFPFVCTIFDDASTDGERIIINDYLQEFFDLADNNTVRNEDTDDYSLVFAQHKENRNCFFAVYYLKYNHYSIRKSKRSYLEEWNSIKYQALCEGDDYWTHPKKLQMQVDFLESHPNHSLCFHANYSLYSDGTRKEHYPYREDKDICPMQDLILGGGGFMATASMVYVYSLGYDYRTWSKSSKVGDGPLMLTLAERGKVGYICELMCCYRVAAMGSWTQRILVDKKKNREHFKQTQQSWREYDEWTNFKYHTFIKHKMKKNKFHYWIKKNVVLGKLVQLVMKSR